MHVRMRARAHGCPANARRAPSAASAPHGAHLRLRARLVGCDQQQRAVHDGRAVEHRGHEDVVPRAVDERDVPDQAHGRAAQLARRRVLLAGAVRAVAARPLARGALEDLGVGVAELDGDVALELVLESHRLHAADGLDDGRLAVRDVADRACARARAGVAGVGAGACAVAARGASPCVAGRRAELRRQPCCCMGAGACCRHVKLARAAARPLLPQRASCFAGAAAPDAAAPTRARLC